MAGTAIRSTVLGYGHAPAGPVTWAFSVPTGYTVLLKHLMVMADGSGTGALYLYIDRPAPGHAYDMFERSITSAVRLDYWIALHPGTSVGIFNTSTGSVYYWMSGALLPGVASDVIEGRLVDGLPTVLPLPTDPPSG